MDKKIEDYSPSAIFPFLQKTLSGSLCTMKSGGINARFMVFACDNELKNYYMLTHKLTEKISEIKTNPTGALSIISTSDKLDDYAETTVSGKLSILTNFDDDDTQKGFKLLCSKSSMVQMMYDSGSMGDYVMIKLSAKEVVFRVYRDILKNVPKTTLRF